MQSSSHHEMYLDEVNFHFWQGKSRFCSVEDAGLSCHADFFLDLRTVSVSSPILDEPVTLPFLQCVIFFCKYVVNI